jgi:hypothetical protein
LPFLAILKRRRGLWTGVGAADSSPSSEKMLRFPSSKRTSPMVFSERMTNRTLHAVDVTGGGRSSVISRKISANRILGMATSAIWKAT